MSHSTTNYNVVIYIYIYKVKTFKCSSVDLLIINYHFPIQIEHPFRKLKNTLYIMRGSKDCSGMTVRVHCSLQHC